jgi:Replication-relaxation
MTRVAAIDADRENVGLSPLAADALECVYQHRLLSTGQLQEMVAPRQALRRTQRRLAALAERGLLAHVIQRGVAHRPTRLWHITEQGAGVVEATSDRTEVRRKLVTPEQAGGLLAQHTLAVNQVGLTFLQAARKRGDEDVTWRSWRHELAHATSPGGPRNRQFVIADAVLGYPLLEPDGRVAFHHRFVELDRATVPVDQLALKLARYTRVYRHTASAQPGEPARPVWQERYPAFPGVLLILTGQPRPVLERRLRTLLALCASSRELADTPQVKIKVGLLEDLDSEGPWAPVLLSATHPDEWVNWLADESSQP